MRRRIATITLFAAALYGGFFISVKNAIAQEVWPEW